MLYGVFSDVHSNLEALTAVLDYFQKAGVGGYLCCGDLVGYGGDPNECLNLLRTLKNFSIICGNHDLAATRRLELDWFNQYARAAIVWTQSVLSNENYSYLMGLSARLDGQDFTLAHGTPRNPAEEYLLSPNQFRENVPFVQTWPLIVGHSHMPLLFRFAQGHKEKIETEFLEEDEHLLGRAPQGTILPVALNPGSVGQPRDQDRRAACALYDSERGSFRIKRLAYDVQKAQAKIRAAGLPEYLALRLDYGQ